MADQGRDDADLADERAATGGSVLARATRAPFPVAALTRNCVTASAAAAKLQLGTLPTGDADGSFRVGLYFDDAEAWSRWRSTADTAPPSLVPAGGRARSSPARATRRASEMILVDDRRASAFHLATGALRWTRDLAAAYTASSPSVATRPGDIDCHELRCATAPIEIPTRSTPRLRLDARTGARRGRRPHRCDAS